jgi:predicted glutamine amidotransferase
MFMLKGSFSSDFEGIFTSLQEVARVDPLLENKGPSDGSHSDGWGYLNITDSKIEYVKFGTPIFHHEKLDTGDGVIMCHARNAAPNEPLGVNFAHPHYSSNDRFDFFLSHNGWFNKEGISSILKRNDSAYHTDSEMFLYLVSSLEGEPESRISEAIELVKERGLIRSSANLLFTVIDRKSQDYEAFYYSDAAAKSNYGTYQKLFLVRNERWSGVFSSSIVKANSFHFTENAEEVERGKLFML